MVKPVSDLHQTEDAVWHRVREREPVIRRLSEFARVPDAEMTAAMAALNLGRSQIYKLLARYRSQSVASALLPRQPGPEAGHSKLDADVEGLIELAIQKQYLSRQKLNVSALCRAIAHDCKARCLPPPSRRAVQARVSRQPSRLVTARREGAKAATDRFRPVAKTYKVDAALAVAQVDHTLIDQIVVDEHSREPLGRPWLTLIVDVASRTVLGFYVTLEDPSATSVAMAIRHAVLPKAAWLAELGIDAPWPAEGIPDCLHMDNAKEFHSRALARGCDEYGIERRYRPPATPHFGGHIERLSRANSRCLWAEKVTRAALTSVVDDLLYALCTRPSSSTFVPLDVFRDDIYSGQAFPALPDLDHKLGVLSPRWKMTAIGAIIVILGNADFVEAMSKEYVALKRPLLVKPEQSHDPLEWLADNLSMHGIHRLIERPTRWPPQIRKRLSRCNFAM